MDRHQVLDFLREFADESMQRRLWLASAGPEVSSFVEAQCGLFDDTGLGDALGRINAPPIFSAAIDDELRAFDRLVLSIDQSVSPELMIESSQMKAVRSKAAHLIELIQNAL